MSNNEPPNREPLKVGQAPLTRAFRGMRVGLVLLIIGLIPVLIDPTWMVFAFIPLFMGVCLGLFGLWIVPDVRWQMKLGLSALLIVIVWIGTQLSKLF